MKKNKFAAILLAGFMALMPVCQINAAETEVKVTVDGLLKKLETKPITVDGYTMVELNEISGLLGAQVSWDKDAQKAIIKMNNKTFEIKPGTKDAIVSFTEIKLPVAPVIVEDRIMVPLRYISEAFGTVVSWDGTTRTVKIDTTRKDYSVLQANVIDLGDNVIHIGYADAIKRINEKSKALNDMVDNKIILERQQKDLDKQLENLNLVLEFGFKNIYTMDEIALFRSQRKMNNQFKSNDLNERLLREGSEFQLRNALIAIEKGDLDIYLLEQGIALDEQNFANIELKYQLGMESESNLKTQKNAIEKKKINLENLRLTQKENRLSLNNLLGYKSTDMVDVTGYVPTKSIVNDDVDAYITQQLKNAPTITLKEIELDNALFMEYSYKTLLVDTAQDLTYKENEDSSIIIGLENDVLSAQRALDDAKSSLENSIRSSYNSMKQLQESYNSLLIDGQNAVNTYKDTVTKYMTGLAAFYDVSLTEMNILDNEISVEKNRISYDTAAYAYNNPYLSAGK